MKLPKNILYIFVFSLNAMLMIITQEILKENFRCPSQILITWNEAFVIVGLVCGITCPKI